MANGRPLWFIGGVVATWTGIRIALLWPAALPLPTLDAERVAAAAPSPSRVATATASSVGAFDSPHPARRTMTEPPPRSIVAPERSAIMPARPSASAESTAVDVPASRDTTAASEQEDRPIITPPAIVARPSMPSRLTLDAWLVARPSGGDTLAFGQLGASQGGARLTYALEHGVALSGRVSAPLRGGGKEVGVGVDLRTTRLPVHLLVEQRIGLDGGGMRPAATAIAGTSAALPARTRLDAYAQGGAVWRRGGFVDAAALVSRTLLERGRTRVELGGGAWGAAQRRASRLDIGPSIALVAPGGGGTLRLQLDYRARLTGSARPGSGPALTLGGSF